MLPLRARAGGRAAVPGEPRAGRVPAHDRRPPRRGAAAPSGLVLARPTPPAQRRLLPLIARRARHVITVSDVLAPRAGRAARARARAGERRRRRRRRGVLARPPTPSAPAPRSGSRGPYVLCVASHTARKNLAALVPAARGAGRRGRSTSSSRAGTGRSSRPSPGSARCGCSATCPTRCCRGSTPARRRSRCRRTTRASGCPCWRRWRPGRRSSPRTSRALPETCGGAARLVPPDGDGVARRAARPARRPGRARPPARRRAWRARSVSRGTPPRPRSTRWCGAQAASVRSGARRAPLRQPSSRRAIVRNDRERRRGDGRAAAHAAQPGPVERARPDLAREPRVPEARARSAAPRALAHEQPQRGRRAASAWPRSVVSKPAGRGTLPFAAGHDSSVSQIGVRPSLARRISRRA